MQQDSVQKKFITNGSMSLSYTSPVIPARYFRLGSIQLVWTGSAPTGTFTVECSNDISHDVNGGDVTNWTTITGSSEAITTSGSFLYNFAPLCWYWVRVVYTRVSGTGTLQGTYYIET